MSSDDEEYSEEDDRSEEDNTSENENNECILINLCNS